MAVKFQSQVIYPLAGMLIFHIFKWSMFCLSTMETLLFAKHHSWAATSISKLKQNIVLSLLKVMGFFFSTLTEELRKDKSTTLSEISRNCTAWDIQVTISFCFTWIRKYLQNQILRLTGLLVKVVKMKPHLKWSFEGHSHTLPLDFTVGFNRHTLPLHSPMRETLHYYPSKRKKDFLQSSQWEAIHSWPPPVDSLSGQPLRNCPLSFM